MTVAAGRNARADYTATARFSTEKSGKHEHGIDPAGVTKDILPQVMPVPQHRHVPCLCVAAIFLAGFLFYSVSETSAQIPRVLGLDISAWQGDITQAKWNNARTNDNRQFVILRSSRGGTTGVYNQSYPNNNFGTNTLSQRYDDPYYIQNINRVVAAGMYAGSYHFSRPDIIATTTNSGGIANTGSDEADHFIQMAGPWMRPGYIVPIHDLEAGDGIRTDNEMTQFCLDFSDRIYEKMGIRPGIYFNGNYAQYVLGTASASLRDQLAQPSTNPPSLLSPRYTVLWSARYPNQLNPELIDVQNGEPKDSYTEIYGPFDNYGVTHPWTFWQYASTVNISAFGTTDLDGNVLRGGIEYLRDQLVPAVWTHNASGDWSTLTNWNSGLTPITPVTGTGQVARVGTLTLPTPRLPGAAGSGTASGQFDTVILERPTTNIVVTLTNGTHNIRKLYMRETLDITGGSLTVNYAPSSDSTTNGAEFSGNVSLSGSASFSVHTLQVDDPFVFTLNGGTLTLNRINLMPGTIPARLAIGGNMSINTLTNSAAIIAPGSGAGSPGTIDLLGGNRTLTLGNGTAEIDLAINVAITNGALTKSGLGTLALNSANTYSAGTTLTDGRLLVNNTTNTGTGSGSVTVNGGFLGGTGIIGGTVNLNPAGTIAPGTPSALGRLRVNAAPSLGGTNFSRIDRNGGSSISDQLSLTGGTMTPLTYGGTLVVSNAGAALVGGEIFTNFSANAYAGSFTTTILPALSPGLNWNLNRLTTDGTIRVNRAPTPGVDSFNASSGVQLQIPIASLLANDSDPDGDAVTLSGITLISTNGIAVTTNATFIFYTNNLPGSDRINYQINDGNGGVSTGAVLVTIAVPNTPPSISQQPTNLLVIAGQSAVFNVVASGSAPLAYQWRLSGVNIGGATLTSLTSPSAQTNDAGNYSVVVTNSLGAITSSVAALTVHFSLTTSVSGNGTLTPSPNQSSYVPGTAVTLTAAPNAGHTFTGWSGNASGSVNPLGLVMGTNLNITATFLNTNVDIYLDNTNSEVTFNVPASWSMGTSATDKYLADYRFASSAAGGTLTAVYRPTIPSAGFYDVFIWYPQGSNRATNAPWSVTFSGGTTNIAVDQTVNGGEWRLIAAARPFQSGTDGFVQVSNDTGYAGKVVMADGVRFTYAGPLTVSPAISVQPQSQTVKAGSNVLFSVTASGTPPPAYQWRFFGTNLSGQTSSNFTRLNAQLADSGNYSVLVSNVAGSVLGSNAVLTVNPWLPVTFQSITALPDGAVQFSVAGNAGEQLWIDRATNLPPAWTPLTNFFNTTGTVQFTDSSSSNSPQGFYRARQ
jgi:autotransporter-associated beta strand protein